MKPEEDLSTEERRAIFDDAREAHVGLLKNIRSDIPNKEEFKQMLTESFITSEN
jgi:hypothetical protein